MSDPSHVDIYRSIGALEQGMRETERRLDQLEKAVTDGFKEIKTGLEEIKARESERRGAWKTIVAVAGFVSAFVTLAVKWLLAVVT